MDDQHAMLAHADEQLSPLTNSHKPRPAHSSSRRTWPAHEQLAPLMALDTKPA